MIFIPRGNPVKENVNPGRVNLPEAMEKLRSGSFTGYLRFDSDKGVGIIIFDHGRLVSAIFQSRATGKRWIAYDAITRVFEVSLQGIAVLNIYRIDSELALWIHRLLHGDYVYQGQELSQVDIRGLLDIVKRTGLSGCLRVYTKERTVLVFYKDGASLGFFHDGGMHLETSADLTDSVACLPGAKLDLMATRANEGGKLADLMESADLRPVWQKIRNKILESRQE